jgi:hypothetical protein
MRSVPTEAWLWPAGLLAVALADPHAAEWFTVCPFDWIGRALGGVDFCPGCGLGRAVGLMARGAWRASLETHPLALPAVALLLIRSATVARSAGLWRRSSSPDASCPA